MSVHSPILKTVQHFIEADQNHDFKLSASELEKAWADNETFKRNVCRKLKRDIKQNDGEVSLAGFMQRLGFKQYALGAQRYFEGDSRDFINRFGKKINDHGEKGSVTSKQAAAFIVHQSKQQLNAKEARVLETEELIQSLGLGLHEEEIRSNLNHLITYASQAKVSQAFSTFKKYFPNQEAVIDAYYSVGSSNLGRFVLYVNSEEQRLEDLSRQGFSMEEIRAQLVTDFNRAV